MIYHDAEKNTVYLWYELVYASRGWMYILMIAHIAGKKKVCLPDPRNY